MVVIPTNRRYIVNDEGEILQELNQGDRILTDNSVKHLTDTMAIKNRFVKMNDVAMRELSVYMPFISLIVPYVSFTDGALRHGNGRYLKASNYTKTTPRYFRKQIKELIDLDVIHKCKNYNGSFFYA
ncbi:MAG: hypothetical protein WC343_02875, partial [Bacilli bacterium]